MATRKPAQKDATRPAARAAGKASQGSTREGFTKEEQLAMRERARELKAESRQRADAEAGERDVLAAIAQMPEADPAMATRIHAIVRAHAPQLAPKTWYGMPAYARDGNVVCFFQGTYKFKARYATLGFNDKAQLDDGAMWPTAFALKTLGPDEEQRIAALVKQAVG